MRRRISEIVTHPLFSGSATMVLGSNLVSFLNYLYHVVMGRMLGPVNYGELAAIISLIGLLGTIPGSLNLVVIKYISAAKSDKEISTLVSWLKTKILIGSLIFSFLILITSPIVSSFLNINEVSYIIIVAISFLISLQSLLNRSILQGLLKFKEMVMSNFLENLSRLLISVILIYLGFKVAGAMIGLMLSAAIGWYITTLFLKRYDRQANPKVDVKKMLLFTVPVFIQSISITSLYSADVILVKHFFSSHEAGIYAALSTLGKIIFFAAGPISSVMFPLISKRNAKGENYRRIFIYSFLATLLVSGGILLLYWIYPGIAIKMLFGAKYLEAAGLLVWFGIFMILFTLSSLLINFGLSLGKTSIVILPLIAAIIQVIMILLFHQTLLTVVYISIFSTALLLAGLLIYSTYGKRATV